MKTVKELWEEILDILEENIKTFSKSILEKPSRISKIQSIEKEMNIKFPKELKDIYLISNGSSGVPAILGFELMTLDDLVSEWRNNKNLLESESYKNIKVKSKSENTIKESVFDENWIPFATNNIHTFLAIDLNPDENGNYGQIINCGTLGNETKYVLADSLTTLLSDTIMIYEYNGLKIEEDMEVDFEREDDTRELLEFLDNHLFDIKELLKSSDDVYENNISYNLKEYDDYQDEDGYDILDEENDDDLYREYDGYGIEEDY